MVRNNQALTLSTIVLCLSALAFLSSCTRKTSSAKVAITIPHFTKSSSITSSAKVISRNVSAMSDSGSDWGLPAPSTISDFNCFGIMVGANDLNQNIALDPAGVKLFSFGPLTGLKGPGSTLSLDVPSGPARTIYVFGFQIKDGATCEALTDQQHELTDELYSPPFLLGQKTLDLAPGPMPQETIVVSYTDGTTKEIGDVKFANGGGGSGGNQLYPGTGTDGDIVITGAMDLSSTWNQAGTRVLSASSPVLALSRPDPTNYPKKFSVKVGPSVSSSQFDVGDDVIFYVVAERSSTIGLSGCEDAANSGLYSGFAVPARVLSAPYYVSINKFIDLDVSDSRAAHIPPANVAAGAETTDFCRLAITRIPQINKLTFAPSSSLVAPAFTGLGPGSAGGMIIIRVKDRIEMSGSGNAVISMSSRGYLGGVSTSMPGESDRGIAAAGTMSNNTGGAGGDANISAGGGGNGGAGLDGWNSSLLPANWSGIFSWISGDDHACGSVGPMQCLWGKIYMGGGGGTYNNAAPTSNAGGGIISIFANSIVLASGQNLDVKSEGGAGTLSQGGGAGGSVLVRANSLQVPSSASLKFFARGGDSLGSNSGIVSDTYAGAGGGGRIHVDVQGSCAGTGVLSFNKLGGRSGPSFTTPRAATPGSFFKSGPGAASCNFTP